MRRLCQLVSHMGAGSFTRPLLQRSALPCAPSQVGLSVGLALDGTTRQIHTDRVDRSVTRTKLNPRFTSAGQNPGTPLLPRGRRRRRRLLSRKLKNLSAAAVEGKAHEVEAGRAVEGGDGADDEEIMDGCGGGSARDGAQTTLAEKAVKVEDSTMPRRIVQRWFLPGAEPEPTAAHQQQQQQQTSSSAVAEAATLVSNVLQQQAETHLSEADAGESVGVESTAGTPSANVTKPLASAVGPDPAARSSTLPRATSPLPTNSTLEASSHTETVSFPTSAAPAAAAAHGVGVDDVVSSVLLRGQLEHSKLIKKYLMAALGPDFTRAGLHTDGVRTSFSVVNYQTIKQATGLKHIPGKLLVSCLPSPNRTLDWIDISAHPTASLIEYKSAIQEVLLGLGMDETMVEDCAEPMQLPQTTVSKHSRCLLLRYAIDAPTSKQSDSFQDLTNRFTIFIKANRIVTVHRTQCTYVEELKVRWQDVFTEDPDRGISFFLYYFVKETVGTFSGAISKCIVEFDKYEAGLFTSTRNRSNLAREIYHIKRRASVYGRTLTLTQDAHAHMATALNVYPSNVHYQEIQHDLAHIDSLAEELNANADSVLQLLFQLSSYQVNELMRVLTLFSAFFIPLGFIAAVYGMNFQQLPLLNVPYGEVYCGALMCAVATVIYLWFKSKHFI